jgi:hypothetical protein
VSVTIAQQKAHEEVERHAAEKRMWDHHHKVTEPEVKELSKVVCEKLFAEPGLAYDDGRSTRAFFVTLTLDTRHLVLDPKNPVPKVRECKYKLQASRKPEKNEFDVDIHVWDEHATWAGSYSPGTPGWKHVDWWHKLQVLREVSLSDKKLNDPTTKEGALNVLLRYVEQQAAQGGLSQEIQAALLVMQDSRRDPASRMGS